MTFLHRRRILPGNTSSHHRMPTRPSSWRDLRRSRARAERNRQVKLQLSYLIRRSRKLLAQAEPAAATPAVVASIRALDRAVRAGVITAQHAARYKSRLQRRLSRLGHPTPSR